MYSSIYFLLIFFVILVLSEPQKKGNKEITFDYFVENSRSKHCIFPPESLYSATGKHRDLLQPCNTTNGSKQPEACRTFLYVSLQLCKAIIKDSSENGSKALVSKFEVNVTDEAVKLENRLCELSGQRATGISNYATYMNNTLKCQKVCTNSKTLCALLVVGLCKLYDNSSPICSAPPFQVNKSSATTKPLNPENDPTPTPPKELPKTTSVSQTTQPPTTSTSMTTTTSTTTTTETTSTTTTTTEIKVPKGNVEGPLDGDANDSVDDIDITESPTGVADDDKKSDTSTNKKQTEKIEETVKPNKDKESKPQEIDINKNKDNIPAGNNMDDDREDENGDNEAGPQTDNTGDNKVGPQTDNTGDNEEVSLTAKESKDKKDDKKNSDKTQSHKKGKEEDELTSQKKESYDVDEESNGSGHFIAYFLTAVVICVAGYIIFHNKQKIFAFVIEGRNAHSRRQRSKGVKYSELKSNVEEVMPSLEKTATAKNFVY